MSNQTKNSEYKKQAYQIVAFFTSAKPGYFDQANPGAAGMRAAAAEGLQGRNHPNVLGIFE